MSGEDLFQGIVIGAAAAAVGAVLAYKFIGFQAPPIGGGEPQQHASFSATNYLTPQTPPRTNTVAAPVQQNTPITEAAYNQYMTDHQPAFGRNANQPGDAEAVLPW